MNVQSTCNVRFVSFVKPLLQSGALYAPPYKALLPYGLYRITSPLQTADDAPKVQRKELVIAKRSFAKRSFTKRSFVTRCTYNLYVQHLICKLCKRFVSFAVLDAKEKQSFVKC